MSRRPSLQRPPPPGSSVHERGGGGEPRTDELVDASSERPSRSARKRRALELQQLGVRLTQLKPAHLLQLQLPEPLLAAVLEAQQLRSHGALARQRQYIGRLMRELDPEPIERALAAAAHGGR